MDSLQVRRWTRGQYDKMVTAGVLSPDDRVELINGEIIEVTPQGSAHATAICLIQDALHAALSGGCHIRCQLPLAIDDASEPEPDIAVVAGAAREYCYQHPSTALLLIEVSDSTLAFDRELKGSLYARAGIADYWIVNLVERCIEVYRDPVSGGGVLGWRYGIVKRFEEGEVVIPLLWVGGAVTVSEVMPWGKKL